jgi:hypothetical protein
VVVRGVTVTRPPFSTAVRPVGSGNEPCNVQGKDCAVDADRSSLSIEEPAALTARATPRLKITTLMS